MGQIRNAANIYQKTRGFFSKLSIILRFDLTSTPPSTSGEGNKMEDVLEEAWEFTSMQEMRILKGL